MTINTKKTLAGTLIAGLFSTCAMADPLALGPILKSPLNDAPASAVVKRIAQQQDQLAEQRRQFKTYFNQAYQTYPALPQGILETLAYTASRWEHRMPETALNHHNMPQTVGLFGLYPANKAGFTHTLELVAKHANIGSDELVEHVESYIMATAAYLEAQLLAAGVGDKSLEASKAVLAKMSGLPDDGSQISHYAINSYLYDLFSIQSKGSDANGIVIKEQKVNWGKVFSAKELTLLRAPGLVIDAENDQINLQGEQFIGSDQPQQGKPAADNEMQQNAMVGTLSTDYPGALWTASPNYSSRSGSAISHVAIHTTQGSYAGAISWLANPAAGASAHYVIRSSDGQVTQMVRDTDKAWHARNANPYSIGIEHEGYVSSSSWYTTAMYNSSADLTQHMCSAHGVDCSAGYSGAGHSTTVELSQSYTVKGHQHFPDQSHTDPGIYWDWSRYADLIGGTGGGGGTPTVTILDNFESGEGSFYLSPAYSGSTTGISTSSTAVRTSAIDYSGSYSEQIKLVDNSSSSSSWAVRFLSNGGSSSSNTKLTVNNGKVGFWVYSGGSGLTAAIGVDDSDGTERSDQKSIPANQWTFLEWELDNAADWNAWYLGNGTLNASQVSIDALWFFRAQTAYNVYVYIDDVQYSSN